MVEAQPLKGRRGPTPAQDALRRIFTWGMVVGVVLILSGTAGAFLLPPGSIPVSTGAIGGGIPLVFAGLSVRKRYREISDAASGDALSRTGEP